MQIFSHGRKTKKIYDWLKIFLIFMVDYFHLCDILEVLIQRRCKC